MAYPSKVLVPLPSSSRITNESWVAFWRTDAVSVHSIKNVPTKDWHCFQNHFAIQKVLTHTNPCPCLWEWVSIYVALIL